MLLSANITSEYATWQGLDGVVNILKISSSSNKSKRHTAHTKLIPTPPMACTSPTTK